MGLKFTLKRARSAHDTWGSDQELSLWRSSMLTMHSLCRRKASGTPLWHSQGSQTLPLAEVRAIAALTSPALTSDQTFKAQSSSAPAQPAEMEPHGKAICWQRVCPALDTAEIPAPTFTSRNPSCTSNRVRNTPGTPHQAGCCGMKAAASWTR